jgi:glycerate kinase
MKILIAPDKFKGSLSAQKVCDAIEKGIKKHDSTIEVIKHPLADGGEGTLEILQHYFPLKQVVLEVQDPLFKTIRSSYFVSNDTAYIEMANASGLQLLKKEVQNCNFTSTIGTGQLIKDAISKGFKNINLFIGGSATNDGGIGMATALGYKFFDAKGDLLKPIGKELINISKIDSSSLFFDLNKINFTVICDVKNPLFGKNGAAFIYASQKGASKKEIELLDKGLQNFSVQVQNYLNISVADIEGAGAAGGLGAGAVAFLNAKTQSGIEFVLEQTNFSDQINKGIDLIITGEGSVDKQTLEGKVIKGISTIAIQNNIPFYIISGIVKDKQLIEKHLKPSGIHSIMELDVSLENAIKNASKHVSAIANNIVRNIKMK